MRAAIYSLWDLCLPTGRRKAGEQCLKETHQQKTSADSSPETLLKGSCLHHLPQSSCRSCLVGTHSRIPPSSSSLTMGIGSNFPFFLLGCSRVCSCTTSLGKSRTRAPEKEAPNSFGISSVHWLLPGCSLYVAHTGAHITQTEVEHWNE